MEPTTGARGRIEVIALTMAIVLALAAWSAVASWGEDAAEAGLALYAHRTYLENVLAAPIKRRPLVVWLGDSTIVGNSYPQKTESWLRDRYGAESRVISYVGLTSYTYYELMDRVLELQPAVLVLVANLRTLYSPPSDQPLPPDLGGHDDLASMISSDELPHALTLPWQIRGMSLPRLLLLRLLRYESVEQGMYLFQGLQSLVQKRSPWEQLIATPPLPPEASLAAYLELATVAQKRYDQPVALDGPFVRMLGASIDVARRAGVRVVVVGSPVPRDTLRQSIGYDPAVYAQRFDVLRHAVEAHGATFLDHHETLPATGFRDTSGHFSEPGAIALSEMVRRPIANEIEAALRGK